MGVAEEIGDLISAVLREKGFDLVEIHYRKESARWVLRLFIDDLPRVPDEAGPNAACVKKGSAVTLDDCEYVSSLVGDLLDSSTVISGEYTLEVSSPGVNRLLRNEKDFLRFVGEKVKVSLYAPLSAGSIQKNFSGILAGCAGTEIEVDDVISGKVRLPLSSIAKAHLNII